MTRFAIGDIQGCHEELRELLAKLRFSADRDQVWFTGDLVNRGPRSLAVLRYVRSLGANAITVLGNHDLHLLALAFGSRRKAKAGDTLDDVFAARDCRELLEWLLQQPLAHFDVDRHDLLVHAGLVPQWDLETTLALAREVEAALKTNPRELFDAMYGDQPERWSESLTGIERLRFAINVLTRIRICTADGRIDLKMKGAPGDKPGAFRPWFEHESRGTRELRVIFGHWSALGLVRRKNLLGLDTGCVWGGTLTGVNLDIDEELVHVACEGYQRPGSD
jgi:bis(5'-nucleosyl)-tetraphosphatase (symmetrical)